MNYDNITDLSFSPDGDFELTEDGDFALARGENCLIDDIDMAVKTQKGDSSVYPDLGADLEELIGQPNTRDLAAEGASRIVGELVSKGIAKMNEIEVIPIPVGQTILYYVFIDGAEKIEYVLNLDAGGIS